MRQPTQNRQFWSGLDPGASSREPPSDSLLRDSAAHFPFYFRGSPVALSDRRKNPDAVGENHGVSHPRSAYWKELFQRRDLPGANNPVTS